MATIRLPRGLRPARDLQRAPHGRAAGHPGQHPLASRELPGRVDRVLVGAGQDLVEQVAVEHGGDEARADALDAVRARGAAGEDGRARRLDGDDPRARVALLEHLAHAGDRPARPHPGDEHVEVAVERVEDLRARRAPVGLGVGGVGELVGEVGVVAAGERPRRLDGLPHAAERLDHLDLRAVEAQQRLALAAHALGQEDHELVALGRAAEGQRDARVARGRLDDRRPPGLDPALGLGRVEHRHADAVLDRAARVEGLELREELHVAALREDPRELHHRRATDVVRNVDRDSRHARASLARRARGPGIGTLRATGGRARATDGFSLHIPYCSRLGGAAWNRRCTTHSGAAPRLHAPRGRGAPEVLRALRPVRPPPSARRRRRAPPAPTSPAAACRGRSA